MSQRQLNKWTGQKMPKLDIDKLGAFLWEAANILRGSIDSSEYRHYIFGLLFLKRLSDQFDEERRSVTGDKEDPDNYQFFVPKRARWKNIRNVSEGIGNAIDKAFGELEEKNLDLLEGVLTRIQFEDPDKLPDKTLSKLVIHFSQPEFNLANENLADPDILGRAYEYLINQFADDAGKKGGEFYITFFKKPPLKKAKSFRFLVFSFIFSFFLVMWIILFIIQWYSTNFRIYDHDVIYPLFWIHLCSYSLVQNLGQYYQSEKIAKNCSNIDKKLIKSKNIITETYCIGCEIKLSPQIFKRQKKNIVKQSNQYGYYCKKCFLKTIRFTLIEFYLFLISFYIIFLSIYFQFQDFLEPIDLLIIPFYLLLWSLGSVFITIFSIINFKMKYY